MLHKLIIRTLTGLNFFTRNASSKFGSMALVIQYIADKIFEALENRGMNSNEKTWIKYKAEFQILASTTYHLRHH